MKKIYIVGLGPGNEAMMTAAAREAIDKSSVVVGYEVYVDLIRGQSPSFRSLCIRAENPLVWILKSAPSFGFHDVETDGLS